MSNRPYRDLTRAEIATKLADNNQSRAQLNALHDDLKARRAEHDDKLWVEVKKMFGRVEKQKTKPDMAHLQVTAQLTSQTMDVTKMLIAIADDDQALQLETHIRDTPELVNEFGPGAD